MDKAAKRVVCAYGAAGVLSQLLFGFIYFAMRDEFVFAPNLRKLTYEEFNWVVQHPGSHSEILTDCCYVLGGILLCVVAAGVVHLLVQRDSVLPRALEAHPAARRVCRRGALLPRGGTPGGASADVYGVSPVGVCVSRAAWAAAGGAAGAASA